MPQNPQMTMAYMTSIKQGITGKVERLVKKDKLTSKSQIVEQCAGTDAPWRRNKVAMATAKMFGISEDFIEAAVRDIVNEEFAKYPALKD